jgi:uncharacterized protein YndB with AHSA1/START domain
MQREGTLEIVHGRCVLRFERRLAHPVEKVWRAITDPAHLAAWFPAQVAMEPVAGGSVRWTFPGTDIVLPNGRVTAYDPPRVLEYRMSSQELPFAGAGDERTLRFELHPDAGGCVLVFTNTFEDRTGAASFAAGWEGCLDALERNLGGALPDAPARPWAEAHEAYVDAFGLLAGTVQDAPDGWTVRFERQLTQPVAGVWAALTGGDASPPAVGGPPPLPVTNGYVVPGVVTVVDPPSVLEYEWQVDDLPAGRVRWELAGGPGGARVVLTQTVPARRRDQRAIALAAWHTHLELLADHLRGVTRCPWPEDRTEELRRHYAARVR